MPLNSMNDDLIRDALRPFRTDPLRFEAAVRNKLAAAEQSRQRDPLAGLSPFLKGVAALIPLPFLTGCQANETAEKVVPTTVGVKLLGYLAFPAISLFVLLGATIFGVVKIRGIQRQNHPGLEGDPAINEAIQLWWRRHKRAAVLVHVATLTLMLIGETWLLFLFYLISFGLVVYVLAGFARLGIGNRQLIGRACMMGLILLGQLALGFSIGDSEIHFVDQHVIGIVFLGGGLLVLVCSSTRPRIIASQQTQSIARWANPAIIAVLIFFLAAWFLNPIYRPATPLRIKAYVESFHDAPYSTASWRPWEIVARWTIEANLDPDLSGPRRLMDLEISGEQNPFILADGFSVGLIRANEIRLLKDYQDRRDLLLNAKPTEPILSLEQEAWIIQASVLLKNLTSQERDLIEKRLLATLDQLSERFDVIESSLLVTRLLKAIDRPVDPSRYRGRVHDWLRMRHSKVGRGFQLAGGFKNYANTSTGSVNTTECAIELMEVYGVPENLDLNWVRSFLKPMAIIRIFEEKWVVAVALDRLNHLPGVKQPGWREILYYERSLIAATFLVALCLYATLSSPIRRPNAETI
jgi:hypothetical protein